MMLGARLLLLFRFMRQLRAGLFGDHVLGVPIGPVRVALPSGAFLVLAVRGFRTPKRARQIARRSERRRRGVDPAGQPRRDLLKQPAVAVRIAERSERAVAATLGIRTADPQPPKQVGLVLASVHVAASVEYLADLDAAAAQFLAGGIDVGDDEVQALSGAGCRGGDVLAKDDRARGARRRELDYAEVVTGGEVGIEPPPKVLVELSWPDRRRKQGRAMSSTPRKPRAIPDAFVRLICSSRRNSQAQMNVNKGIAPLNSPAMLDGRSAVPLAKAK